MIIHKSFTAMDPFTFCLGVGVSGPGLGLTGMAGATATFTAASTTASVATAGTAATAATVATATAATAAVASSPVWIPALAGAAVVGAAAAVTARPLGVLWPEAEANTVLREFFDQDLLDAAGNFTSKLGGGFNGTVYAGTVVGTGVAVKVSDAAAFAAELNVLGRVRHPNIIAAIGFARPSSVVYELASLDLRARLYSETELVWSDRSEDVEP